MIGVTKRRSLRGARARVGPSFTNAFLTATSVPPIILQPEGLEPDVGRDLRSRLVGAVTLSYAVRSERAQ